MKRALVTGGAGFIGSFLCEELLDQKVKVIALDNLFAGSKDNLKNILKNKGFKLVIGDIRDKRLVEEQVKKVDLVYHLAAIVGVSVVVNQPIENISVNIDGTKNIVEAALKHGKKLVFASSSETYGKNTKAPLKEDSSPGIFGSTKISRWAYGHAKALGEHLLFGYKDKGLKFAITRYFNCYGPRGINPHYANVIPKFIHQALSNEPITVHNGGLATRSFCYVTDTVKGTVLAAKKLNNDLVNIGSDKEISILQLAKKIKKLTKSKSKIKPVPEKKIYQAPYESASRRVPDTKKVKRLLGFSPQLSLDNGLIKTIQWTKTKLKAKI